MRYPVIVTVIIMMISASELRGQFYETGQDPSSVKWLQIKTGRFTVIYPKSYGENGLTFAKSLEESYSELLSVYPAQKVKIPVIIHSLTTKSNGYVAWAPKRMELFPTPEQNTIPLSSVKQLTLHELAHVYQMKSLYRGFSKAMAIPFGQQFTGIVAAMLPQWYLEGDAVFAETLLSRSGRGRTPSFIRQLKAITIEKGQVYKYDRMLNDSYASFVPDHYETGFQIVSLSKLKYGLQTWNDILKFTGDQPFTIIPVNISLNRLAGLSKKKLFDQTFDTLRTIWNEEIIKDKPVSYDVISPEKNGKYNSYYSPAIAGTDSVIALKTTLDRPYEFVLINTKTKSEKRVHIPGQVYPLVFSYSNGNLAWIEKQPDPRWENREYSVIKIMNLKSGLTKRLTRKSRYQSASLSPNGSLIAATENSIENRNSLVLINTPSGNVEQIIGSPDNIYLQKPQWTDDGKQVTFIFLNNGGEGVIAYRLMENSWSVLLESGRDDLQSAFLRNDTLFYVSSISGTENIYFRAKNGNSGRITRSKFGATDLYISGDQMIFSDYSSTGNSICATSLSRNIKKGEAITKAENLIIDNIKDPLKAADNQAEIDYSPVPYRKWQHLFSFHSWFPFYADLEEIKSDPASVRPGLSLLSQNQLSTLVTQFGYEYSQDKRHVLHSRVTFSGWYPVFESKLDYGTFPGITKLVKQGETVSNPSVIKPGLRSVNTVSVPLRFSSGRFTQYFRPSVSSDFQNDYIYLNGLYDYGQTIVSGRVYFSNYSRSVNRDIYPRWAQVLDFNYSYAPFDRNLYGTMGTLKTTFYFPGLLPHNSLKFRFEKEKQTPVKFLYGNRASYPRGYKNIMSRELELYSADYTLPLLYPDLSLSSLLYLKRIRAGLFYDYGFGTYNSYFKYTASGVTRDDHNYRERFSSTGFEILADFHLLRIPYMITGGVQTIWMRSSSSPVFEFVFNIDLYGMTIGRR
jgi:hypothetical protein